jgi:hypothetical protein
MDITVYLPDELGKWAKEHELGLSRMLREAVEAERRRRDAVDAALVETDTTDLPVEDDDGNDYTARIHGKLIGGQEAKGGYGGILVFLGKDEQVYVYTANENKLYRDVTHDNLRDWLADDGVYAEVMRALGEEVIIDIGLPQYARGRGDD